MRHSTKPERTSCGLGALCAALLLLSCLACGSKQLVPPGPPLRDGADITEECGAICTRYRTLGCQAGQGHIGPDDVPFTADDESCEEACFAVQQEVPMPADCIVAAGSCAQADKCQL